MKAGGKALACVAVLLLALLGAGCSHQKPWVEDEVTFVADGLTIHGTYRHQPDASAAPAALLISESGNTDRNGDNAVAGPVGNMRQLAEYLSDHGVASLRYDKVGTGRTGLGPYAKNPADVGTRRLHRRRQGRDPVPGRSGRRRQGPALGLRPR